MAKPLDYNQAVRDFDHSQWAALPAYAALRAALSDFAEAAQGLSLSDFLEAVEEAAAATPYGDTCPVCDGEDGMVIHHPHKVKRDGYWVIGEYRCDKGHVWPCSYQVHFMMYGD